MAINDVAGRRVCHVRDILRELLLGHKFVSGLRTLKTFKNLKKLFLKKPRFSSAGMNMT